MTSQPAAHRAVLPVVVRRPTCGRDRARPKKSSPENAPNRRKLDRKSQKTPMSSLRLASPITLGLALSRAPRRAWLAAGGAVNTAPLRRVLAIRPRRAGDQKGRICAPQQRRVSAEKAA
jgi:hypothetical protein